MCLNGRNSSTSFSSDIEDSGVFLKHPTGDDAVHPGCGSARHGEERSVWGLFNGFPHVVVRQIRLIKQEQRALEVIEYVLFRFAVSYVLQEVQVSLISTP